MEKILNGETHIRISYKGIAAIVEHVESGDIAMRFAP